MALVRGTTPPSGVSRDLTFTLNPGTTPPIKVVRRTVRSGFEPLMDRVSVKVIAVGTTNWGGGGGGGGGGGLKLKEVEGETSVS